MLNVRDECDLPEDDGYDLFTRETEVERRRGDELRFGARRLAGDDCKSANHPARAAELRHLF
jgi:hypothetical protein